MTELTTHLTACNQVLAAIQQTAEGTWVAVKPICNALGVNLNRQLKKLQSDSRFSCRHMSTTGPDGKSYQMLCIPSEQIPAWLNLINSNKVRPERRQAIEELQKFFSVVLNEAVRGRFVTMETHNELKEQLTQVLNYVAKLTSQLSEALDKIELLEDGLGDMDRRQASVAGSALAASKRTAYLRH